MYFFDHCLAYPFNVATYPQGSPYPRLGKTAVDYSNPHLKHFRVCLERKSLETAFSSCLTLLGTACLFWLQELSLTVTIQNLPLFVLLLSYYGRIWPQSKATSAFRTKLKQEDGLFQFIPTEQVRVVIYSGKREMSLEILHLKTDRNKKTEK